MCRRCIATPGAQRRNLSLGTGKSLRGHLPVARTVVPQRSSTRLQLPQNAKRYLSTTPHLQATVVLLNPRVDDDGQEMSIEISERAAKRLKQITTSKPAKNTLVKQDTPSDSHLRVTVTSGGCHGFQYLMSLESSSKIDEEEDTIFFADSSNPPTTTTTTKTQSATPGSSHSTGEIPHPAYGEEHATEEATEDTKETVPKSTPATNTEAEKPAREEDHPAYGTDRAAEEAGEEDAESATPQSSPAGMSRTTKPPPIAPATATTTAMAKGSRDGPGQARVVMDQASLELLKGSTIDFTTELIGSQFKIVGNPRATSSCGCGTSFDIE